MTQQELDTAYLREYVAFGCNAPVVVAKTIYTALSEAHQAKDYETVAHLQLRLFSEMVMTLETFGALLLGYSRWDKPGGLLGKLLGYRLDEVSKFIKKLQDENNVLDVLGFPDLSAVREHSGDANLTNIAYTNEAVKSMIMSTCDMYLEPMIKMAFNKIKHGGMWIRDPEMLKPAHCKVVSGENVSLITYSKEKQCYEYPFFRVTGDAGIRHADKHFKNITAISKCSRALAGFVIYFLERDLMQRSENPK